MLKQLYDRMVYIIYCILKKGEDDMCDEKLGKGTKDEIDAENYEMNKRVEDYREAREEEKKKGLLVRVTDEENHRVYYMCPTCGEEHTHYTCVEDEKGNHYCPACGVLEPPCDDQTAAEAFMDGIRGDLMNEIRGEACTMAAPPIVWQCPQCQKALREGTEHTDGQGCYYCPDCADKEAEEEATQPPIVWACPSCGITYREGSAHEDGHGGYFCPWCRVPADETWRMRCSNCGEEHARPLLVETAKGGRCPDCEERDEEEEATRSIGECPFCGGFVDLYIAQEDGRVVPRLRCSACPAHTQDLTSVHDLDTGSVMVRLAKTPVWLEDEEDE